MAYSTAEAWIINLRYDVLRSDCVIMSTQRTARVGRVYTLGSACGRRDIGHGLRDWRPRPFGSGEVHKRDSSDHRHSRLRTDETLPLRPCRARLHLCQRRRLLVLFPSSTTQVSRHTTRSHGRCSTRTLPCAPNRQPTALARSRLCSRVLPARLRQTPIAKL